MMPVFRTCEKCGRYGRWLDELGNHNFEITFPNWQTKGVWLCKVCFKAEKKKFVPLDMFMPKQTRPISYFPMGGMLVKEAV